MRAAGGAHGGGVLPLAAAVVAVVVAGGRRGRRGQGDELGHHVGVGGAGEAVGPEEEEGEQRRYENNYGVRHRTRNSGIPVMSRPTFY